MQDISLARQWRYSYLDFTPTGAFLDLSVETPFVMDENFSVPFWKLLLMKFDENQGDINAAIVGEKKNHGAKTRF